MNIERVIDHTEQGLALLITQYRGKPLLAAWASAYLRQVQLLEDAIFDVLIKRLIDRAEGEQLRVIGRIVGEEPNDDDDATFRVMILARIRINRSRGNTDDVLAVLTLISATGVMFHEYRSACLFIGSVAIPDRDPVLIYSKLRETKAGGVKLTYVVPTTNTMALLPMSVGVDFNGTDGSSTAFADPTSPTFTSASAAFTSTIVGLSVVISGAADADNNGTFPITARTDATSFVYTNPLATVDANDGALVYSITHGITDTSNPDHAAGDQTIFKATTQTSAEPFALVDGMTLGVTIDQLTGFKANIVFSEDDFADIGAATAEEVLASIVDQTAWNFPADVEIDAGTVRVTSRRKGLTASQIDIDGTANAILGFATGVNGTGDVSFGLAADVVTLRQPLVEPSVVPGAPIIAYVDPEDVQELP